MNAPARTTHDRINIPGGNLTLDEAERLAMDLHNMVATIRRDQAAAVCAAEGHQPWRANGYLTDGQPVTLAVCQRRHCGHRRTDPGHTATPDPQSDLNGTLLLHLYAAGIARLIDPPVAATIGISK